MNLIFAQPVAQDTLMLLGAVPVPGCFRPTDDFLRVVEDMGIRAALQSDEEMEEIWGTGPVEEYVDRGRQVMQALSNVLVAEKASLN